jgi:hypothetical protein
MKIFVPGGKKVSASQKAWASIDNNIVAASILKKTATIHAVKTDL